MNALVAVLCVTTILHVLTLMAVMSVLATLDFLEIDSTAVVRNLLYPLLYSHSKILLYMTFPILCTHGKYS